MIKLFCYLETVKCQYTGSAILLKYIIYNNKSINPIHRFYLRVCDMKIQPRFRTVQCRVFGHYLIIVLPTFDWSKDYVTTAR